MNKHAAYRLRCRLDGRCPHCGKPCLPYAECDKRRSYKRHMRAINRGIKYGVFTRLPDGRIQMGDPNIIPGVRGWYATNSDGQEPRGLARYVEELLEHVGHPMSEDDIMAAWVEYRLMAAADSALAPERSEA